MEKNKKNQNHGLENLYSLSPPLVLLWMQIYGVGKKILLKPGRGGEGRGGGNKQASFPDLQS